MPTASKYVPFDYVKPGGNKAILVSVDFEKKEINAQRVLDDGNKQPVKFISANLELIENNIAENGPFSMDKVFSNGGNARSVIEALLARTPEFHACWIDRRKHLVWVPSMPHNAGSASVIEDQDIPAHKPSATESEMQKIFFGTPGSGKSNRVKKLVAGHEEDTFRTTFHPDSDYASFVGSYKPVKDDNSLTYEFVPQAFTDAYVRAWQNCDSLTDAPVYLVIEEINRGNCAQIFGDLFQLLDRKADGSSEYPVKADKDLRRYLERADVLGPGHPGIEGGNLRLPANLHILATMNTSDQSLFPMDSAFKRRWDWEYVPIEPNNPASQFTVTIGDRQYAWKDFLIAANERIKDLTESEDKQMGGFFITRDIEEKSFKSKVMFYLWSEVCKEEYRSRSFFRSKTDDGKETEFSFNELFEKDKSGRDKGTALLQGLMTYLDVKGGKTVSPDASDTPDAEEDTA